MSIILDGKTTSNQIKEELSVQVKGIKEAGKRPPHLAAVLVGNDGASLTYVGSKVRSCERIGYDSTLIKLEDNISPDALLETIEKLNNDPLLDGFIVQLPLPKHIDEEVVLHAINPNKDVDGFHPTNFGKMALGMETFIPATPFGIMELLKRYKLDISGKHAVVIGRSHIVGRPMSILLSEKGNPGNATVTLTHSRTQNLAAITKEADIVVGPYLSHIAAQNGKFVTPVDGDQPSLLIGLMSWARLLGLEILAAGQSSEYDFIYHPERDVVSWRGHEKQLPEFREVWSMGDDIQANLEIRARLLAGFPQRTVPDLCEMGIVCNHTGLLPDVPDFHAPHARVGEVADIFSPISQGSSSASRRKNN